MLLKNKRGEVTDVLLFIVIMFFLVIAFLTFSYFTVTTGQALNESGIGVSNEVNQSIADFESWGGELTGGLFLILFGGGVISILVTSFLVRIHPIFIFIYIFVLSINLVVAVVLGNAYASIIANEPYLTVAASQPIIHFVMDNIVLLTLGIMGLSMIIVFSKLFGPVGGESI